MPSTRPTTQQTILVLGSVRTVLDNLTDQLRHTDMLRNYVVAYDDDDALNLSVLSDQSDLVLFLPRSTTELQPDNEHILNIINSTPTIYVVDSCLAASQISHLIRGGVEAVVEVQAIDQIQMMIDEVLSTKDETSELDMCKSILDQMPLMICLYDKNYTITYANESFTHWHKEFGNDLVGKDIREIIPESEHERFNKQITTISSTNPFATAVQQQILPDHSISWAEFIDGAIYDESGEIITHLGIGIDVTERIIAYKNLEILDRTVRHQHSHITSILDSMQEAIFAVSLPDRDLVYVSRSFAEVFGYPHQEFLQDPEFHEKVIPPDDLQVAIEAQQTCMRNGSVKYDHRIIHPDGAVRWIRRQTWLNYDSQGKPTTIIDSGRDITNEKFIEQELRDSEQQYRLTLSNISDAIFITDDDGLFTFICPNVPTLFGYTQEEVRQFGHISAVLGDLEYDADILEKQGEITNIEWQISTKSGEAKHTLINIKRIQINKGKILYTIHDVTELKRVEKVHIQQQQRLNAYFNNTAQGILVVNRHGVVMEANEKLAQIFGYVPEELKGQHLSIIVPPSSQRVHDVAFEKYMGDPDVLHFNRENLGGLHKDGYLVPIEIAVIPLDGQDEAIALVTDITFRIEAQAALKQSKQELEQRVLERTEELQRVKNQIEAIFNNSGDGILVLDTDVRIRQSNDACEWLLGIPTSELYDRKLFELIHDEDIPFIIEALSETQLTGIVARIDTRFKNLFGYLDTEVSISPVIEPNRKTRNFVCVIRDMSERKHAQEILEARERLLQTLADNYPAYLAIIDQELVIRYAAGNDFRKRSADPSQYIGRSVTEILGDQAGAFEQQILKTFVGEEQTFESSLNGGHYLYHTVPLPYKGGVIGRILIVGENITDRKQSELAIKESEERYRLLAENVTDMISRHLPDGTFAYVSPASKAITGYTPDELLGCMVHDFQHPEDIARLEENHNTIFANLSVFTVQYRFIRKDSSLVWVETTSHTVRNDVGEVTEIIAVTRDITQRKQVEEALQDALARERELSQLKSRIVSNASHEFRTPLSSILATTETLTRLRRQMDEERIDRRLQKIVTQVNHMRGITQDMLDFTRLQAQEYQLERTENNVNELCQEVVDGFNEQKEYANRILYASQLSTANFNINIDRARIHQVINNIIHNALKYSAPDTLVDVMLSEDDTNIIITVIDQGIGIPEQDLKHLFSAFYRASNVGTISGTGLGLSLSKQIVELHNGDITVETIENKGSTFKIIIPKNWK